MLVSQSTTVGTGGDFMLRLRILKAGLPATAEVAVTVYRAIQSRSDFEATLQDRISRSAVAAPSVSSVTGLNPDANGEGSVRIAVRDPGLAPEPGRIDLGADVNVFPVRVELRERAGTPLERFVTHLVYLPGTRTGPKLAMSLVFPVQAGPGLPPDGEREVPGLDELASSIQALEAARNLPFAMEPSPETVQSLAASGEDRGSKAVEALRRLATDHAVIGSTYVPLSLPSLLAPGLGDELTAQLAHGTLVLGDTLGARPDARTWIERRPLDPESVDELVRRGVERFVSLDAVLDAVPDLDLTLSRPFVLAGREEDLPAAAADAGLAAHFNKEPDQVLQAQHLLADLAVLWLDEPGSDRRGVIAIPPPEWRANRAFMDTLAAGLAAHPVAEATSLDTVFSVEPATTFRGTTLVRHPAKEPLAEMGEVVAELRAARKRLVSLGTVLDGSTPGSTLLEERLLTAESALVDGARARHAYVAAVEAGISDFLGSIEMPRNRSITLTARQGQIPVTFQNRTGTPAKVVVTVESDKLEFPGGDTRPIELARRNTTERFPVLARTSGAFPLRITLHSPDGNLVIDQARLTVRSTAASRVSLVVSAGAVAFLAIWWGRHVLRGRRAKRLVPA
ncbi:MAG: DUF6049 family protein [Acidimicrobiales bacterium]